MIKPNVFVAEAEHRSWYAAHRWAATHGGSRVRRGLYGHGTSYLVQFEAWLQSLAGFRYCPLCSSDLPVGSTHSLLLGEQTRTSPVIRPPMILRQSLVDNKNCGLVYKPLQEEIAMPHMPKRGSFYSSSTFHYDKIVPESV